MNAERRRTDAQIAMPLGFRADDRDIDVELAQRSFDVADVRNVESIGELLIALVSPIRNVRIIGDDGELESRMRDNSASDIVMLDRAERGAAKRRVG